MVDEVQLYVIAASPDCILLIAVFEDVLSAALDSGVAISVVAIFFILQYPKNGHIGENNILTWWGNTVSYNNADGRQEPLWKLADRGTDTFGYVLAL